MLLPVTGIGVVVSKVADRTGFTELTTTLVEEVPCVFTEVVDITPLVELIPVVVERVPLLPSVIVLFDTEVVEVVPLEDVDVLPPCIVLKIVQNSLLACSAHVHKFKFGGCPVIGGHMQLYIPVIVIAAQFMLASDVFKLQMAASMPLRYAQSDAPDTVKHCGANCEQSTPAQVIVPPDDTLMAGGIRRLQQAKDELKFVAPLLIGVKRPVQQS